MAQPPKVFGWSAYREQYSRHGPGIEKDTPKKTGIALFFEILRREWLELIKLNMLFLLFCVPVLTIPAASTAMSKITVTMVRDKNYFLLSDFLRTFRAEFLRSTSAGWIYFGCIGGLIYAAIFYYSRLAQGVLYTALAAVCAFGLLTVLFGGFYLFPMIASVSLTIREYLRNSLFFALICLRYNLLATVSAAVVMLIILLLFPYSVPLILLFAPALINFIATFCACHGIRKFIVKEETF